MRPFRVIVIDDDADVLERLRSRVERVGQDFEGMTWRVDLGLVKVVLEETADGKYRISTDKTLSDLAQKFSIKPDLILLDYGYATREVYKHFIDQDRAGQPVTWEQLQGKVLIAPSLMGAVRDFVQTVGIDSSVRRSLKQNLLRFDGPVVLYTMTSRAFVAALGQVEDRRRLLVESFDGTAKVSYLDTKYEFYDRDDILVEKKHDTAFYAQLVSGLLAAHIQIKLLEAMLSDARRSQKHLRVRRSAIATGIIVAAGGGVGALGDFLGGRLTAALIVTDYSGAAIIGALGLIVVLVCGMLLPFAFGSLMSDLLRPGEEEPRDD